ncbi:hypothetical protein B0T10DRAFT_115871 [Thelonectria olida]|uniref:ML-like domain-containing protein n=1 Tax=Thelonectria olida TaxID=1576542 RepID=A0A9P8WIM1_9HYPO|nr:hypothetical protein B0T10DRAFT_115871 [Thelonectria olida]
MTRFASVVLAATALATGVLGGSVLETTGFTDCGSAADIEVTALDIKYDSKTQKIDYNVAGSSKTPRNVTAVLSVTAYGTEFYNKTFNPCAMTTYVKQLCPVPAGDWAASGSELIPDNYADMVPSIAFQVPDISAQATLKLINMDDDIVACIESQVSNGKTVQLKAVTYAAVGILGASMAVSGFSAASSAAYGSSGGGLPSPSFSETLGWFQGMAMNGMLSVSYPPVYRSFTKNFGFSAGIIPWSSLQTSIDSFRNMTGGNITVDSFETLQTATLVFPDNSTSTANSSAFKMKRALDTFGTLLPRDDSESVDISNLKLTVSGISAYAQQLSVPKSNTFMTVLLIVAIVVAAIVVGILLVKVILEFWALFGSFPQSLAGFRKHYWGSIARAITSLILLLYGMWVLYCVFQFTNGDSWAAKTLAGVTLAIFTAILAFFSWKIYSTVQKLKKAEGNPEGLYQDKDIWVKYSLFYESYKKDYWWLFIPTIIYLFSKGCILAAGDGHGTSQTIAQCIVEALMLGLLIWSRPYERKSGTVIGIAIQVVRVLSVVCILVFVEELGIQQTTKTVVGVVLIAVQSALTGLLVILIVWNAINIACKENPHRKRRKEMEKMQRDVDTLTPLDARNSLLLDRKYDGENFHMFPISREKEKRNSLNQDRYSDAEEGHQRDYLSSSPPNNRNLTPHDGNDARLSLVESAAPMGWADRAPSPVGQGRYDNYGSYGRPNNRQSYGYGNGTGGGYRGF